MIQLRERSVSSCPAPMKYAERIEEVKDEKMYPQHMTEMARIIETRIA